jgi:hypothetical protein
VADIDVDVDFIERMARSPIRNYVVPGITSWLIGAHHATAGCVRMLTCDREQVEHVTPHSHRFSFHAVVLAGSVRNRLWRRTWDGSGDFYSECSLAFGGEAGKYTLEEGERARWSWEDTVFAKGQGYGMAAHEVHSIYFARGTKLLIFEGCAEKTVTSILQPVAYDEVVPTFKVEPWMFRRESSEASRG